MFATIVFNISDAAFLETVKRDQLDSSAGFRLIRPGLQNKSESRVASAEQR